MIELPEQEPCEFCEGMVGRDPTWMVIDECAHTVTAINPNGRDITVDFPQQAHWTGVIDEMELVPSTHSAVR